MPICVVVVEDEILLRALYVQTLSAAGFDVVGASDALACRVILDERRVDLVVLDIGLPGLDGIAFSREIRARQSEIGLMIVSRRSTPEDRVLALESGCDDFMVKPVHLGELCARTAALARRRAMRRRIAFGCVIVDLDSQSVTAAGNPVAMTRGEIAILALLGDADGKIVTRERLASAVSRKGEVTDPRTVDALVRRIRRKIEMHISDPIVAVAGFGYRLSAPARII